MAVSPVVLTASDPDPADTLSFDAGGTLPPGLGLVPTGPTTAEISGVPTSPGTFPVTIGVSDGVNPPVEVHFDWTITDPAPPSASVTQFVLVDAASNADRRSLSNGAVISLLDDAPFNIRAEISGAVKSVVFELNGVRVRTENAAPYALVGDSNGDYWHASLAPGVYHLTATPFTAKGGKGDSGTSLSIQATIQGN